ncbi:ABC transporter permease [Kribbella sp. NBC_00709]|uniref:ABC transporter permease subunit n=1 Tax=Kribbella sp. NBC_00709 TaxID=2975972 RepID=UPI002E27DAF4|nr:ABC transporter permease subunit [Kribbella sp. NBC_00709]
MFRSVYLKSMYDARRGLIGWSIAIAVLVLLESALWPSVRDMLDLTQLYQSFPEALRKFFNLDAMTTGAGFLNAELFTLMLPGLFLVFGIGHGARAIAGEEERGTLELLLVTPVSGARIVFDKALALATSLAVLGLTLFAATTIASPIFGLGISPVDAASGALAMTLLGLEYGVLALAVGALTGRRTTAIGIAAAAATAAYVVYAAGLILPRFEDWQPYSPIHQAFHNGPLGAGLQLSYLWLLAGSAVLVAIALPTLDGRDISTAHGG